jgi:hypothetical protein
MWSDSALILSTCTIIYDVTSYKRCWTNNVLFGARESRLSEKESATMQLRKILVRTEDVLKYGSVGIEIDLMEALVSHIISLSTYSISSKCTELFSGGRATLTHELDININDDTRINSMQRSHC